MGFNDGKFYDAKLSMDYYDALKFEKENFDMKADGVRLSNDDFEANEQFDGEMPNYLKRFVKYGGGKMLNDNTDTYAQMINDQRFIMNSFESIVDPSPNARLEINTLEKINTDFKAFHKRFDEIARETHQIVDDLNREFGGEIDGGFPQPESRRALESFEDICGGYDPGKGFFKECQDKLLEFDATVNSALRAKDTRMEVADLNKRIQATKNIIGSYIYNDPNPEKIETEGVGDSKIKEVKILNKKLDYFCDNVNKYFDNRAEIDAVAVEASPIDGNFLCSFDKMEGKKGPLPKAIIKSPTYGPYKKIVTKNAKRSEEDPTAYTITPQGAALTFGVGGAMQSYIEKGDFSDLGKNAKANYEAFQQGSVNYMIDKVAGTRYIPGRVQQVAHAIQGKVYDINLPDATGVPGLLNTSTAAAGMNDQIKDIWSTFREYMQGQGSGKGVNVSAAMNNFFQGAGYTTLFGSSFFGSKFANKKGTAPTKGANPKFMTVSMVGSSKALDESNNTNNKTKTKTNNVRKVTSTENSTRTTSSSGQTITSLSKAQELLLKDPTTGKYGFEELAERIRNGYQPTKEELDALAELWETYFGRIEVGTAKAIDYETAERLLKVLVVAETPEEATAGYIYKFNEKLAKKIIDRLDPDSLAVLAIVNMERFSLCGPENGLGTEFAMNALSFDIKKDRAGIALSMYVDLDGVEKTHEYHETICVVSNESATNYIKSERAKDSGFGNGVNIGELARILTSVQTQDDMNFFEKLINDNNYNDAFSYKNDLSFSAQMGLADYHLYFYQTDVDGIYRSGNAREGEFLNILNSAISGESKYLEYLYNASELRAASSAITIACCDNRNSNLKALYGEYRRELTLTNLYWFVTQKDNENSDTHVHIDGISQTVFQDVNVSMTGGVGESSQTYTFSNVDSNPNGVIGKLEVYEAHKITELLDEKVKSDLKTLAKDCITGAAAFFGPEALILAMLIDLGIDSTDTQRKISLNGAYTNALKIAKQNGASAGSIDTASNMGSTVINVLADVLKIYNDSAAYNSRLTEEQLKYKAIWFGTGAYYSTDGSSYDVNFNSSIISPMCVANVRAWQAQGLALTLHFGTYEGCDNDLDLNNPEDQQLARLRTRARALERAEEIIQYIGDNHDEYGEAALERIRLYLTGTNNNNDKLSLFGLEDYEQFNKDMLIIEDANNAIKNDNEPTIDIEKEWSDLCQ
ncbi:hypothetical protein D6853_10255 [Butyrivibrio sp. X503]|uniref:hypothetical protein n=1 Tax=Butyrivibrio sp. X503 TaxID=2364878 RepID=UPI000EAA4B60|nr:hypothetical protein [Butyrivibrio sp. X503]RKM55111.1 hypothetical protein D6853_10255 [Butyrivibrio sp. X503]